ncbi:hypothetical protein BO78DRAFT_416294 [Aspergillus sclerotiicarbonarius CBS 121057]|uniref:Uncharacterized protein n=1 Tax=Aspergillus sclerotiicarbonarius (strain CBS 121057 / IBT 28362) TaxID=1448318 RepID=A0A319EH72_ASPSB|nr:hypothetical protein BO78DRAFT_416294 [Aspergillus sclerotiicarbonarius CBS 121057]
MQKAYFPKRGPTLNTGVIWAIVYSPCFQQQDAYRMRHLSARFAFTFTFRAMFSGLHILILTTIARDEFRQPRSQSGLPMSSAEWHCAFKPQLCIPRIEKEENQ